MRITVTYTLPTVTRDGGMHGGVEGGAGVAYARLHLAAVGVRRVPSRRGPARHVVAEDDLRRKLKLRDAS